MTLKAIIRKAEDGGYWGEGPSLPGRYSQGETIPELEIDLREAAQGCLAVLREEGVPRNRKLKSLTWPYEANHGQGAMPPLE